MRHPQPASFVALALLGSFALAIPPATADESAVAAARSWRAAHGPEILARFAELLAMPNVASDAPGIRANAEWIRDQLESRGVATELWSLPGVPPVVYGGGLKEANAEEIAGVATIDGGLVALTRFSQPIGFDPDDLRIIVEKYMERKGNG